MDLTELKTEDLEAELQRRAEEAESDDTFPHVFLYSKEFNQFETDLIPVRKEKDLNLLPMQLRCRYNQHRGLTIYSVKLSAKNGERISASLKDINEHKRIFETMKHALIQIRI